MLFFCSFSNCYRVFYGVLSILSYEIKVIFIWCYLDLFNKFFWKENGYRVLDVINFCCYCCLILLFVLTCFLMMFDLINVIRHFFTPLSYLRWKRSLSSNTFLQRILTWTFEGFLSVPHLVDVYAKNADEQGRNFMCKRTLPSLLVIYVIQGIDLVLFLPFLLLFCSSAIIFEKFKNKNRTYVLNLQTRFMNLAL